MLIYIVVGYKNNKTTGERVYFLKEKELYDFLDSQDGLDNQSYRGIMIDPFKKEMIFKVEERTEVNSSDYLLEYKSFKKRLKNEYLHLSVALFLNCSTRLLDEEKILKIMSIS